MSLKEGPGEDTLILENSRLGTAEEKEELGAETEAHSPTSHDPCWLLPAPQHLERSTLVLTIGSSREDIG